MPSESKKRIDTGVAEDTESAKKMKEMMLTRVAENGAQHAAPLQG
jgi:hypothetical protein